MKLKIVNHFHFNFYFRIRIIDLLKFKGYKVDGTELTGKYHLKMNGRIYELKLFGNGAFLKDGKKRISLNSKEVYDLVEELPYKNKKCNLVAEELFKKKILSE